MDEKKYEELMDRWVVQEMKAAPETVPAPEVYRKLEAKARRRGRQPISWAVRWGTVGLVGAAVILFVVLRPSPEAGPPVGLRTGFAAEKEAGEFALREEKAAAGEQIRPAAPVAGARSRLDKDEVGGGEKRSLPKKEAAPERFVVEIQFEGSPEVHEWDVERPGEETLSLSEQDNFRLALDLSVERTVYVFQFGPGERLAVIFPNPGYSSAGNPLRVGRTLIPPPPNWFFPAEAEGEATMNVVISGKPNPEIEGLIERYSAASRARETNSVRAALAAALERLRESPGEGVSVQVVPIRVRR
jgi:hypothetical protein